MRLLFFGTPDFAVPTLARLLEAPEHAVVGVVSQPDRPRGRGRSVKPSPVSALALEHDVPFWRPEKVGEETVVAALRDREPDLGVVVAFGQFLPKPVRELPRLGYLINGHASILPRYRGAAPIARAILSGDRETGISVMRVAREMDAGPVALVRTLAIGPDEDTGSLTPRLADLAAEAIVRGARRDRRRQRRLDGAGTRTWPRSPPSSAATMRSSTGRSRRGPWCFASGPSRPRRARGPAPKRTRCAFSRRGPRRETSIDRREPPGGRRRPAPDRHGKRLARSDAPPAPGRQASRHRGIPARTPHHRRRSAGRLTPTGAALPRLL